LLASAAVEYVAADLLVLDWLLADSFLVWFWFNLIDLIYYFTIIILHYGTNERIAGKR
jgi:hypothetical protein